MVRWSLRAWFEYSLGLQHSSKEFLLESSSFRFYVHSLSIGNDAYSFIGLTHSPEFSMISACQQATLHSDSAYRIGSMAVRQTNS